ncbi:MULTISPECIES: KpsF/GutQ family sugar-phosphate isomerase [Pandoraea]|uniref:Arabinose 5-phosphate isomerase n=1 Tax=Pandoraea capi TaxID=2508286 RepID=A0ABY6VX27_9BURK|nr:MULTISPECIES: KpsF/GutQ family sugar-phosphate isomerase [Pandoraea]MCI3206303.1 KpsF/GutQ family sugar-phosphate isomerase [Pandoraea sp. LA3]MDN4584331.1 KpsF/GutQ family sugar-phosphate isomerase [Pandoraea capi]VVD98248.1 arabinose 5-phosphate isomerase [Pandoraea capi]
MIAKINPGRALEVAREVLRTEADAIERVSAHLDDSFFEAVSLLLACKGRVVVTGMGKSGHIGRKLAATFASTGTPAFFVHPAEASHGDLGMITADDVVVALSNSGETGELVSILPMIKRIGAKLIAMTGNAASSLGRLSDVHLDAHVEKEACPLGLAPTASTTAALALGDALAVTLLDARGFGAEDFARSHPGGALGRRLLTFVRDVMRTGDAIPRVRSDANLSDALIEMTAKGLGMTAIVDADDRVVGIFTDGDLRRLFKRTLDFTSLKLADVMKAGPRTIGPDHLAAEAAELMERFGIMQLLVTENDRLVGALNVHDLFAAKVV